MLLAQERARSTTPSNHFDHPNSLENTENVTFSQNVRMHFGCSKITQEHSSVPLDASGVCFGVSGDFSFSSIFRTKHDEHETSEHSSPHQKFDFFQFEDGNLHVFS